VGFNSVVLVLNDRLRDIEEDKEFGPKLASAIRSKAIPKYDGIVWPSQTTVLGTEHADVMQIWAIGANGGRLIGRGHWQDTDEELLVKLAEKFGYFLTPRERRKKG
jgi:hypothetical protein